MWYGRLLVERIEGFCTVGEWQNAFEEIALFESLLTKWYYILIKCWLHVDKENTTKTIRRTTKQSLQTMENNRRRQEKQRKMGFIQSSLR
jgi:polyphosphate kinase 2 (PPK2 family)